MGPPPHVGIKHLFVCQALPGSLSVSGVGGNQLMETIIGWRKQGSGFDCQGAMTNRRGLAELKLTGVMVTFRTRPRLNIPRPLVTNPSLPAGRVALRSGGNVLGELESYGRGPKWTPRTGLQTGSVASESVRWWDDFPLVDSPCLSGTFGSWISCPDILHLSGPISWTS